MKVSLLSATCIGFLVLTACEGAPQNASDAPAVILETLAADDMGGRLTGSDGNAAARQYILEQLNERGVSAFGDGFERSFKFLSRDGDDMNGINLLARIDGTDDTKQGAIVLTAHYDHVGERNGQIYNGADDNASGVAGLFAIMDAFADAPPSHDFVFAFLDAEEMGLQGARALFSDNVLDPAEVSLNLNFDMISRSDKKELYAVGTYHYPQLEPIIDAVAAEAPVTLLKGYDEPTSDPRNDWTLLSDHAAFHYQEIPFIYFGVEDHADYHQPGDDFEKIDPDFLNASFETVVMAAREMDKTLD